MKSPLLHRTGQLWPAASCSKLVAAVDTLLTNFIHALRNADVRISTAETLDALRATELVGYSDRKLLKDTLALTLPKTLDEKNAFDACFDQFFSFRSRALPDRDAISDESSPQQGGVAGEGQGGGGEGTRTAASDAAGPADLRPCNRSERFSAPCRRAQGERMAARLSVRPKRAG